MSYVIRRDTGIDFYYYLAGRICKRTRTGQGISTEDVLAEGILDGFSMNIAENGERLIFCRRSRGDVLLIRDGKNGASSKEILKTKDNTSRVKLTFDASADKNSICLVYNAPSGSDGSHNIYIHRLSGEKTYPRLIDKAYILGGEVFRCTAIGRDHRAVFYMKRQRENILGYREILGDEWGKFNSVFTSAAHFVDYSRFVNSEGLYFLGIVNNLLSSRLLYRCRTNEGFSGIRVVADMNSINMPVVFGYDGKIYIFFRSGRIPYIIAGEDRPRQFRGKICSELIRGTYIDLSKKSRIRSSEVLLDREKPWDIQLFDEIDENFYAFSSQKEQTKESSAEIKTGDYSFRDFFGKKEREFL